MPTRREILGATAGIAGAHLLPKTTPMMEDASFISRDRQTIASYRERTPLAELQQRFVDKRLGMFVHFNMATFQDREWGDPNGTPETFAPNALDTDGWAQAAKSAGMQFGVLTTKHHDGFPIWATKTVPDHSSIDVVRAYVDSFRKAGLGVGLYFSILDLRHDIRHFNIDRKKIDLIKDQLTELFTQYGEVEFLIFDGWDAPWSRIPYSEVPFSEIYAHVKRMQPDCLIAELNASEYPPSALYYTDIKSFEQNAGQEIPEGNRIPALSCVTLTEGWFWKEGDEDRPLKSAEQVVDEWLVPQNRIGCSLIVNAAPNREGKFAPNIVSRLAEIGERWKRDVQPPRISAPAPITTLNLASKRPTRVIASADTYGPDMANDGNFRNSWYLPEGMVEGWIEVDLTKGTEFNRFVFAEPIGRWKDYETSRIDWYRVFRWEPPKGGKEGFWVDIASGRHPDPVQIIELPRIASDKIRLAFTAAAPTPHLSELGVYLEPARVSSGRVKSG